MQGFVRASKADSICTDFADRWGLDADLLKAQIPGLAKLEGMSVPPPMKNYARLACFGMVAIPWPYSSWEPWPAWSRSSTSFEIRDLPALFA